MLNNKYVWTGIGLGFLLCLIVVVLHEERKSFGDAETPAEPAPLLLESEAPIDSFNLSVSELKALTASEANSEGRDLRLSLLVSRWFDSTNEPNEIANWIASIKDPPSSAFGALAVRWVAYSPEHTIEWISTIENKAGRDDAIAKSMAYARSLKERRFEYIVRLVEIEGSPSRHAAILKRAFMDAYRSNPESAFETIETSKLEERMKEELLENF